MTIINKKLVIVFFIAVFLFWAKMVFAQEGTLKWKYHMGDYVRCAPAIGIDSSIYISGVNFSFYALHSDSTLYWSVATSDFNRSPVIATDGTIYVNRGLYLVAYNPNGTEKWSKLVYTDWTKIGTNIALGPDGTIYMGGEDTTLRAFDNQGNQKWKLTLYENVGSIAVNKRYGTIYTSAYSSSTSALYAINPNGTFEWKINAYAIFGGISFDHQGNIYVGSDDKNLYCFYPNSSLKWAYQSGGNIYNYPVFGEDSTIYFGSWDGNLYALNLDGSLKWKYQTGSLIAGAPAVGNDGIIYFGSWDWYVYALNPNGTFRWRYQTGYVVSGDVAIDSNGTLYIGSDDTYLYAIHCSSTGLANSPWPRAGHDNQNTGLGGEPTSIPPELWGKLE